MDSTRAGCRGGGGGGVRVMNPPFDFDNKNLKSSHQVLMVLMVLSAQENKHGCDQQSLNHTHIMGVVMCAACSTPSM